MRAALIVIAVLALAGFLAVAVVIPNMAGSDAKDAAQAIEQMHPKDGELPEGDPLIALQARTQRSRPLALNQVVETPPDSTRRGAASPGFGPALGGLPGSSGPFGGRY